MFWAFVTRLDDVMSVVGFITCGVGLVKGTLWVKDKFPSSRG